MLETVQVFEKKQQQSHSSLIMLPILREVRVVLEPSSSCNVTACKCPTALLNIHVTEKYERANDICTDALVSVQAKYRGCISWPPRGAAGLTALTHSASQLQTDASDRHYHLKHDCSKNSPKKGSLSV
eukprot:2429979-Amphidinium_carterae.1